MKHYQLNRLSILDTLGFSLFLKTWINTQQLPLICVDQNVSDLEKYTMQKPIVLVHSKNGYSLQQKKVTDVIYWYAQQTLQVNPDTRDFTINLSQLKSLAKIKNTNHQQIKQTLREVSNIKIEADILGKDG